MNAAEIRTFIRAGRAVFTLQSARTGTHFTYRISQGEPQGPRAPLLFASVLIAPEVWGYLGVVGVAWLCSTTRAKVSTDAPSFKALAWFLRQLDRGELPASVVFRHEGRCGRCGRALTTPASIDTGLGPDCAEALGVAHEARAGAKRAEPMPGTFGEYDENGVFIGTYDDNGTFIGDPHGGPALARVLAAMRLEREDSAGEPGEDDSPD